MRVAAELSSYRAGPSLLYSCLMTLQLQGEVGPVTRLHGEVTAIKEWELQDPQGGGAGQRPLPGGTSGQSPHGHPPALRGFVVTHKERRPGAQPGGHGGPLHSRPALPAAAASPHLPKDDGLVCKF